MREPSSTTPPRLSAASETGYDRADHWAQRFHDTYERLAPSFGYETRRESAVPWDDVPENNRLLMTAVVSEVGAAIEAEVRAATLTAAEADAAALAGAVRQDIANCDQCADPLMRVAWGPDGGWCRYHELSGSALATPSAAAEGVS